MFTFTRLGNYGRLGNQLFQIASLAGIAASQKVDWIMPEWKYSRYFKGPFNTYPTSRPVTPNRLVEERFVQYCELEKFPSYDIVDILGYFQTERYWQAIREQILSMLSFTPETIRMARKGIPSWVLEGLKEESIGSIHFRRGDYLKPPHDKVHNVCDIGYFQAAIMRLREQEPGIRKFIIFTDDPDYCRKTFSGSGFLIAEDIPRPSDLPDEIVDLYRMSICAHNIVCNSSFSWWASYLNRNEKKKVMAPERWFASGCNLNDKDIYHQWMSKIPL